MSKWQYENYTNNIETMKRQKIANILSGIALIIIAIGVLMPLVTGPGGTIYRYVFSVGAVMLLVGRILDKYRGELFRGRRLYVIQRWSARCQCAAAFFMFYSIDPRDWLVFVLAGAVLQLYVSIMVPVAIRKAAKK